MEELLKVDFDGEKQTVSARELHNALEIEKRFSAWFETNSQGFSNGEDFTSVLSGTVVNNGAHRDLQDYKLSVDMAKHICLMSRTEKGKQCRQYLIDLEKAWNTPELVMARGLKAAQSVIEEKQKEIEEMKPKAEYFDALVEKKLNTNIRDTATELHVKEKWFVNWLIEKGYCYRKQTFDGKTGALRPKSQYKDTDDGKGLFTVKDAHNPNCNWAGQQMLITPKGKETFRLLLESEELNV